MRGLFGQAHVAARLLMAVAALAFLAALAACKERTEDVRATLQITSSPSGAAITIAGVDCGTTPFDKKIKPGTYLLKLTKQNCKPVWEKLVLAPKSTKSLDVQLQPMTAATMISSVPSGVKVEFNGEQIGETPLTLQGLQMGPHSVILKKLGYVQKEASWVNEDERPKSLKIEMSSNVGTLKIESTPSACNLFIDGEPRGHTPFSDRIEQGQHKVRIEKEGFSVFEQLVTVNREKVSSVAASLQMLPGSLAISSSPSGAAVFIGDKQYENTPTEVKGLQPGSYSIRLEKPGYDRATSEVTLRAGQRLEIDLSLDNNTGGIDLVANPPGVTVYVDGRMLGNTEPDPAQPSISKVFPVRNLGVGQHTIMVAHKRAVPDKKTIEVTIKKGKIERLPVLTMWIANATMKLRGGPTYTGRLIAETDTEVMFEPEPGIRQSYKKDEIVMLKLLKDHE